MASEQPDVHCPRGHDHPHVLVAVGDSDRGAQWAMAHPVPGKSDDWLMTERVGKHLPCEIGQVEVNGPPVYSCVQTGRDYEYRAFIHNDGSSGCLYQLEGGGVT